VQTDTSAEAEIVFCTQDAKLCPDGSYVGREGPNCEFAACPSEIQSEDETAAKGNVETTWKVEEGESAAQEEGGVQQYNESDLEFASERASEGDPDRPLVVGNAAIVSVSAVEVRGWDAEEKEAFLSTVKTHAELHSQMDLEHFAQGILLKDENVFEVEVDDAMLTMHYKMPGRLFGIFTASFTAQAEAHTNGEVKVKFPWYSFLYSKYGTAAEVESELSAAIEADLENWGGASDAAHSGRLMSAMHASLSASYDTMHRMMRGN
jgi:hypothetical protein